MFPRRQTEAVAHGPFPKTLKIKSSSFFILPQLNWSIYMKLRLLTSMAGIDYSHNQGDIIEINDPDAAKRYIENGVAEPVAPTKETAAKKTPAKRKAIKE
jgi:hypothetical protein